VRLHPGRPCCLGIAGCSHVHRKLLVGVFAFFVGIPGPFHGLFNIDLGLFIAYAVSSVVFVTVSLMMPRGDILREKT